VCVCVVVVAVVVVGGCRGDRSALAGWLEQGRQPRGRPLPPLQAARTLSTGAMRAMRSAACCLILALLLLRRHLMVPQIWGRYGLARLPSELTTVPKPLSITLDSSVT
jgi:hypothetical protein